QVVLPLLENELGQVIVDVMANKDPHLKWKDEACVGVVLASKGYPGQYQKGGLLPEKGAEKDAFVVQAGTKRTEAGFVANGGRGLLVGATEGTIDQAAEKAYHHITIYDETDDFYYRTDIGK